MELHDPDEDPEETYLYPENAQTIWRYLEDFLQKNDVKLDEKSKTLEIGSGSGLLLEVMHKQGLDAVGVDARPRGEYTNRVLKERIEKLPFADGIFDLVIGYGAFDTVSYDQDQKAMLKEITRILKDEGALCTAGTANFDDDARPENNGFRLVSDPLNKGTMALYKKA